MTKEELRLKEAREQAAHWKRWGPYLSERQWGTVREDYSPCGSAWDSFPHDHARSRAYRWGEDGLAGISDNHQRLCFAVALWNGRDPILKERLFGLTGSEGNHGEDVKELYYYLDSTPTHSYMRMLYKYPQAEFPYQVLRDENRRRGRAGGEYELADTGAFEGGRYFDVFVEFAKAGPEDILVRIEAANRGPERAELDVLPTLWFRNTWSWNGDQKRPSIRAVRPPPPGGAAADTQHSEQGSMTLGCEGAPELLFTENDSNLSRLHGAPSGSRFVKDAFHEYVVKGDAGAVNPDQVGTKCAARYRLSIAPGASEVLRLRLRRADLAAKVGDTAGGRDFEAVFAARKEEADAFYATVVPPRLSPDAKEGMRQALAGMLWSKQFYHYVVRD